jgi:hypothetical protein
MITVLAKKIFRFFPPNFKFDSTVLNKKAGQAIDFIDTKINEPVDLPDWVAQNDMFKWAQKDGDLYVIAPASPAPVIAKVEAPAPEPASPPVPAEPKQERPLRTK